MPWGDRAADYRALQEYFQQPLGDVVLPGELIAAAFLHLVAPDTTGENERVLAINNALKQPSILTTDKLEIVIALDWCWDALDPVTRHNFLLEMIGDGKPLTPADSPLDHRVFRQKLATLALVLAVDETDQPSPSWAAFRENILTAANQYFATTFPTYVSWRGLCPTTPSQAAYEENDTALAIELADMLNDTPAWPKYRDSVGRWMEHYLFAASESPSMQHQFLRDRASNAPLTPAISGDSLLPLTAHLIASRTRDPAAAYVVWCDEQTLADTMRCLWSGPWRWVPIVFDSRSLPRIEPRDLPLARNLGGAVVFNGDRKPNATRIWIDIGPPFLRDGQHLDAGHFLIRSGGYLAVAGGEHVELEATRIKDGLQRLGCEAKAFDFSQYHASSIAHNCMLFHNPARAPRWHGTIYTASGGQQLRRTTCTDFVTPLDAQKREIGKLTAYGYGPSVAYAATDLSSAYDPRSVTHYVREFVFLSSSVLIVIDRAATSITQVSPTWVVNIPSRPTVAGHDLTPTHQIAGSDTRAGIWQYQTSDYLHWEDRNGAIWMKALSPQSSDLRVVGGPARQLSIQEGSYQGRGYVGGAADSFEHLVNPTATHKPANAWYRLGHPTLLGPHFGIRPHWGRIEIAPNSRSRQHLFVNALVVSSINAHRQPAINIHQEADRLIVSVDVDSVQGNLELSTSRSGNGKWIPASSDDQPWILPSTVMPDPPLHTRP